MRWRVGAWLALAAALGGCSLESVGTLPPGAGGTGGAGGGTGGGGVAGGGTAGGPETIGAQRFPPPSPWATPIEDYIEAGQEKYPNKFMRAIHDLAVYQDRLYLGYGDANVNMGRIIPIGFRYFPAPDDPNAINEFNSDEEQIERYRHIGERLVVAGVDATEDAWLGNVYLRGSESGWVKSRTLDQGVHVHDVCGTKDQIFAVGSGSTPEEWDKGDIYAQLWLSTDLGDSFHNLWRVYNGGTGDARFVRLLLFPSVLYVFGYGSNAQFVINELLNVTYDGHDVVRLATDHPLALAFVTETDLVAPEVGIVRGVDRSKKPLLNRVWTLPADGAAAVIEPLAGRTVVDLFHYAPTGETLLLTYDGDDYQAGLKLKQWQVRVLVTTDFASFAELVSFPTDTAPVSIAYWQGHIFYGTGAGQVWRATGTKEAEQP